jgi:hypothetical protein
MLGNISFYIRKTLDPNNAYDYEKKLQSEYPLSDDYVDPIDQETKKELISSKEPLVITFCCKDGKNNKIHRAYKKASLQMWLNQKSSCPICRHHLTMASDVKKHLKKLSIFIKIFGIKMRLYNNYPGWIGKIGIISAIATITIMETLKCIFAFARYSKMIITYQVMIISSFTMIVTPIIYYLLTTTISIIAKILYYLTSENAETKRPALICANNRFWITAI